MKRLLFTLFAVAALLLPQFGMAQQSVPYSENFDSYGMGSNTFGNLSTAYNSIPTNYPNCLMPTGWSFIGRSTSSSSTPNAYLAVVASSWGSATALMFKSNGSNPMYAILPRMATQLNQLQISFSYKSASTTMKLGYVTDINNASTFHEVASIPTSSSLTTFNHDFSVDNIANGTYYIAIKLNTSSSNYTSIDNVNVTSTTQGGGGNGGNNGQPSGNSQDVGVHSNSNYGTTHPIYSQYTNVNYNYPYGATWTIYTASELGLSTQTKMINGIGYQFQSDNEISVPVKIYMGTRSGSTFSSSSDTMDRSNMSLVYSGNATFNNSNTYSNITFSNPYTYDPTQGNLVVLVERTVTTGRAGNFYYATKSNSVIYRYVSAAGNTALTYRDDKRSITRFFIGNPTIVYTVSTGVNDPSMGYVNGGGSYNSGSTATLTAVANAGYHFVQWSDGNTNNPRTVTVSGNATYTATFAEDANTHTITVVSNNNTYGTVTGGGTYADNAQATLTATPANGYEFVQWGDGNTDNPRTITVTADATYVATFQATSSNYTITAISNNASYGTVTGGGSYANNAQATLTAIPADGYEFVQWNDGNTTNPRTITVTGNATYVATFAAEEVTYTLTVMSANETYGTVTGSGSYSPNAQVSISAIAADGYRFVQWQDGNTDNPRTVTVTANATYIATFGANEPQVQYTISAVANDDARGTVTGSGTYDAGTVVTMTATPSEDFQFVNWNDGERSNPRTITVSQNATYVANFVSSLNPITYFDVNALSNNAMYGTVTGGGHFAAGTTATLVATANSGYHFVCWSDGSTQASYSIEVTGSVTLLAVFEANEGGTDTPTATYHLTVGVNNASYGNAQADAASYTYGAEATIIATANTGYHFVSWSDGNTENPRSFTVTGNATYMANFVADGNTQMFTVSVTSSNAERGMVTGAGTFPPYSYVAVRAIAYDGYTFSRWNNGETDNPLYILVTGDTAVQAEFGAVNARTYTLTVVPNDPVMGTTVGGGTYEEGYVATIAAVANEGYHFVRWNDGVTDAVRQITVQANATYVATFAQNVGIADIEAEQAQVFATANSIVVRGAQNNNVFVYDIAGRLHFTAARKYEMTFNVARPGIYIVKVGSAAAKRVIVAR